MSSETFDTLGNQKLTNYALRADMTKEEFIKEVTTGLKNPPQYFPNNVKMNKSINKSIDDILTKGTKPLNIQEFKILASKEDVLVIDTRSKLSYTKSGTIPGAWWIGLDGGFAPWVGALITDINQKIVFICDENIQAKEVVTRLSRVGYDNILGYLNDGIDSWKKEGFELTSIGSVSADAFAKKYNEGLIQTPLDVRKENEYNSKHIVGLENFPLDFIHEKVQELDKNKAYFIHCAGGYRSLITCSIMQANGINNVTDIRGGFDELVKTELSFSEFVCPSTML